MRIAVIGIVVEKDRSAAERVNKILSEYGDYIVGRMGVPDKENHVFVISVIVKANNGQTWQNRKRNGQIRRYHRRSVIAVCHSERSEESP